MKLLAIDPGQSTGWAMFNTELTPMLHKFDTAKSMEDFFECLIDLDWGKFDVIVAEDYKVRPAKYQRGYAHEWNALPAAQVLGAIKFWAWDLKMKVVLQQPAIKPVGYGFLGLKYVRGKTKQHHIDAIAHGAYYLIKHKICNIEQLRTVESPHL